MTNLAICKKCRALTPDTDEDIAEHRKKHIEQAADIERARKAASEATTALDLLRATVRDYEQALERREVPVEPEINLRVVDDDEDDLDADEDPGLEGQEIDDEQDEEPSAVAVPPLGAGLYTPRTEPIA